METLNIQCIEQQQVLITLTLTDSNGAPVDLTKYAVYAASVGAVDPYCRRAARLEWATAINNECSAFIITSPGHDIARAPWKYQICIKNRQLGLEWVVVSGRVELTPRACGTDGISPAAYSVSCEATPSGLVNVTLDATVGSISTTLEQVKASAAAAAAAAQNAHADLEDAETAATKASQAALAAAADARIASEKATAAEAAATAAPEACAPYVQQVQQAAASALEASRAATTAAAEAQASADAAAPAQGYATRAEQAQTAAVQASAEATAAATTATQQAEAATAQAESARLASTTASTASDNAQAAATRAEDAATRAEAAAPAATRAEAARDAAEAAAATATTAAADVPGLVQRAETAATASEAAQTAAETAQSAAETAASTATAQAEAAAASAAQADTDARACALFVPRAEAAQQAAADSASAAAASETAAAASATAAAASVANAVTKSYLDTVIQDEELRSMVNTGYAAQLLLRASSLVSSTTSVYAGKLSATTNATRLGLCVGSDFGGRPEILVTDATIKSGGWFRLAQEGSVRVLIAPNLSYIWGYYGIENVMKKTGPLYVDAPKIEKMGGTTFNFLARCNYPIYFSPDTIFLMLTIGRELFFSCKGKITFNKGTTFAALEDAASMFQEALGVTEFPEGVTFAMVKNANAMFLRNSALTSLPQTCTFTSITTATNMFCGCTSLEIDDLARVLATFNNLQELETPIIAQLGLPKKCKHNGAVVDTYEYLNANYPETIGTLNTKGWTVTFA